MPIALKVGSVSESVTVTTEAPVVDTADSRTQLTLENQAVAQLPIVGRNLVTLVTMAPGVSGLGTSASGSPASGVDNFSTEEQVDASANGQGQNNNQYVVDGLDVTSGIRQGVLNLTPQPEAIQETSIQVNTFSSEYSRAAGLQTMFTTKSGTDQFHGSASDYFNYQGMFASQHFVGYPYQPFHSNNMDFAIGGPMIPHHNIFFYFAVEPLRSSSSAGGSVTFADPEFISFAQANNPNTVGTDVLTTYLPVGVSGVTRLANRAGCSWQRRSRCGTAVVENIPCSTPMIDTGSFGATSIRNGTQYFARIDQGFKNDRIYASLFRTLLLTGAPSPMPQFSALNNTWQVAGQATWTHTFSPTTLNDFTAGQSRVEGVLGSGAKDYTVPSIIGKRHQRRFRAGLRCWFRAGRFHSAQLSLARRAHAREGCPHAEVRLRRLVRGRRRALPGAVVTAEILLQQSVDAGTGCSRPTKTESITTQQPVRSSCGVGMRLPEPSDSLWKTPGRRGRI